MTATTVLARNGHTLSGDVQADGWMAYINGGDYSDTQQALLAEALMAAQRDAFDAKLPDGCHWYPTTSEIVGPVDAVFGDNFDLDEAMSEAANTVADAFDQIERDALGTAGVCTVNVVDGTIIVVTPTCDDTDILVVAGGDTFSMRADVEPWGETEEDMDRADGELSVMGWQRVGEWRSVTDTAHVCDVKPYSHADSN